MIPKYYDMNGNIIKEGMFIHCTGDDPDVKDLVVATHTDGIDLGIQATSKAWLRTHPDAEIKYYSLSELATSSEWVIVDEPGYDPTIMGTCVEYARMTMTRGEGGPFGAAIVKDGRVITVTSNSVLIDNDPTAHAEMNAIREACKKLGTYDLSGCELYATGSPCPMCLSAIIWANIKKVYIGGQVKDAEAIGFRDHFIYKYIEDGCLDTDVIEMTYCGDVMRDNVVKLYNEYDSMMNRTIY